MMSKAVRLCLFSAVLIGLTATLPSSGFTKTPWSLIAHKALGRIEHMRESQESNGGSYDFATVLLDAPADKVFATALDLARKNIAVRIVMQDPGRRRFQVAQGDRTATFNVVPFNEEVSQIMIAGHAGPGEDSTTSRVVQAVLRVCKEMGKHCQVGD